MTRYDLNSCFPSLKAVNCLLIISTLHFSLFVCKYLQILSMESNPCTDWESVLLILSVFQCVMAAKSQGGGSLVEDKSQSDKNCGDCKMSDVTTPCQCVCHSKANRTTAAAATPATVDLTVSPCKETAQPPPPAPEHSKYLIFQSFILLMVLFAWTSLLHSTMVVGPFQWKGRDFLVLVLFYRVCTKCTCKQRCLWYKIKNINYFMFNISH